MRLDWKKVWHDKGLANTADKRLLSGYEHTTMDPEYAASEISNILQIDENSKILEVGCGVGFLAEFMNCNYHGIDFSETIINKHRKFLSSNLSVSEANCLPFEDNYFESSYSYSVFQYFPNFKYAKQAIDEMLRVSSKRVFIGDLPVRSHSEEHLLYNVSDFEDLGFTVTDGYYNSDRFNAWRAK